MEDTGLFTISLDFELYWGIHDHTELKDGRNLLETTRQLIPDLLYLFEKYDIHATWATVGFLFAESMEELRQSCPQNTPKYSNEALSPYRQNSPLHSQFIGKDADVLLALDLIKKIHACPGQEIASHTFSHFYCLEDGPNRQAFKDDLQSAQAIAQTKGYNLNSLVFPRNQYSEYHTQQAISAGFTQLRTQRNHYLYKSRPREQETPLFRLLRGIDSYLPLSGHATFKPSRLKTDKDHLEYPASIFLRPLTEKKFNSAKALVNSLLTLADPLHLKRVRRGMELAAIQKHAYHLWFHPHNLALHPEKSLNRLEKLLEHFSHLRDQYQFKSVNMQEVGALTKAPAYAGSRGTISKSRPPVFKDPVRT